MRRERPPPARERSPPADPERVEVPRLRRLVLPAFAVALAVAAPAALADPASEKASVDTRIDRLEAQIEAAKRREHVLTTDIGAAAERIGVVEARADQLAGAVAALEAELVRHRNRLAELREQYALETRLLMIAERQEQESGDRLEQRIVELYQTEPPDTLEILLTVSSLGDLVSQLEYSETIARRDREIAESVARAREEIQAARARTAAIRAEEAATTAALASRTLERQQALDELIARRDELHAAQADREALLAGIQVAREDVEEDLAGLEAASEELTARIRSAAGGVAPRMGSVVLTGALGWPVNGPITSGFGQRWGRLHAGIDIGVGFGTPIGAAAGGVVIHAGWLGGYGNLVVIDHGGGLSTAYGHQQAIYVRYGQQVGQGQVIGEVGSTGNSTGPHLHFEVRVNGSPVDPLGYL